MNAKEIVAYNIKQRREWVAHCLLAAKLYKLLPLEIQVLDGCFDCDVLGDKLVLRYYGGDEAAKVLKMEGVIGLTKKKDLYEEDGWYWEGGELILPNGTTANFKVINAKGQPGCRIEAYKEEVTKYRAICPETEAAIV